MLTSYEKQKEKENLLGNLSCASIFSAKNGRKGIDAHLSDFQINYLCDLVKGDLEK